MNFVKTIPEGIYKTAKRYIGGATLMEGKLDGDHSFKCLFIENSNFMEYVAARTYVEKPRILKRWRIWIPAIGKIIENQPSDFDMCIASIPKEYDERVQEAFDFKCDEFVRQVIDVSGTMDEVRQRFHKKKRQISNNMLSKSGLSYRISKDMNDFDLFYRKMFIPLIRNKYGDQSDIESYEDMKIYFQQGFLLMIISGSHAVAGALCVIRGDRLVFRRSGVLGGEKEYIKNGAQNALYLFNIVHAKELGLKNLDTMNSMSMMNDGVYRTKREWGASVHPDEESKSWIYFHVPRYSGKTVTFFEKNPLIVHTKDGLCGLVGLNGAVNLDARDEKNLCGRFLSPGLKSLMILTPTSDIPIRLTLKKDPDRENVRSD